MVMIKNISLPAKLIPVFADPFNLETDAQGNKKPQIRYRGAHGGRGSAKTRSFAKMAAVFGMIAASNGLSGVILCAREFYGSLADSSFVEIKGAIEGDADLSAFYECGREYIRSRCGKIEFKFAGLRHNIAEVKGTARILILWVDEAEPVSDNAWTIAINTVREDGSEIWVTWNPERKTAATNIRFHSKINNFDEHYRIIDLNWRDNAKFPAVLELERNKCYYATPELYEHIWEGDFRSVTVGAYYSKHLIQAKAESRVTFINRDPLNQLYAIWDIGSSSNNADATAIWICQKVNGVIRWLDYYEAVGQDLATHLNWLRSKEYNSALNVLPHDGAQHERVQKTTYEGSIANAGFQVVTVPNQGRGAALLRIESARRQFHNMIFNEETCKAGIEALSFYHEKRDDVRQIGLGVHHDWSSHGADAFGLGCVYFENMVSDFRSEGGSFKVKRLV